MCNEIRIYVTDLAAYNNGKLHGVWIDATQELDDIEEQVWAMLADSPEADAGEYAIHDYEGYNGYRLKEYSGLKEAHEVACFIEEYSDFGAELLNHFGCDLEEAKTTAEDNYAGCYKSLADYAQDLTEQTSDIPQHLQYYIDYEKMARDMNMSGDVFTIGVAHDEVHVFWNY